MKTNIKMILVLVLLGLIASSVRVSGSVASFVFHSSRLVAPTTMISGIRVQTPVTRENIPETGEANWPGTGRPEVNLKIATPSASAQNRWLIGSICLIIFVLIPGLLLFYGAYHRTENILVLLGQSVCIACLVSVLWWCFGYRFIFGDGGGGILGDFTTIAFLKGAGTGLSQNYRFVGSQNIFCAYQLMFALFASSLIVGLIAGRVRFSALLIFITLWVVLVYFPLAHMLWGVNGLMNGISNPEAKIRSIDFGGGAVIQMAAGWSGFILFAILGKRGDSETRPLTTRRMIVCITGEIMLWIGWYGFNSGSGASIEMVPHTFMVTTLATLVAAYAWVIAERGSQQSDHEGLRFSLGALAGLAAVSPASGFVTATGAVVIGLSVGLIPLVMRWANWSRSVEPFSVHVLGGMLGVVLTGVMASAQSGNTALIDNAAAKANGLVKLVSESGVWFEQLKAVLVTFLLAGAVSTVIASLLKWIFRAHAEHMLHLAALSSSNEVK